jgi:hypothetical protein
MDAGSVSQRPAKSSVVLLAAAIAAFYALHQDLWFWPTARPLILGFLPVGLAYHGAYCVAAAALMWALTRLAWPAHLEEGSRR